MGELELAMDDLKESLNETIKQAPPVAQSSFLPTSWMHLDDAGRRVYDPEDFAEEDDARIDLPGEKFTDSEDFNEESYSAREPLSASVTRSSFTLAEKAEHLDEAGRVVDDSFADDSHDNDETTDANDSEEP